MVGCQMMAGLSPRVILLPGLLMALAAGASDSVEARKSAATSPLRARAPSVITIDYPEEGSIFPPEITPPTFLWRDGGKGVTFWRIDVSFGDGPATIHGTSQGERMRIGRIDPDCVAGTNEPPRLTPHLAAAHRQDRSGLRRRDERATQAHSAPGGGAFLDAGPCNLAGHQAAFGRERRDGDHHRLSR